MIKGNDSDVGNIDFELQAKKGDKFLCFTLLFELTNCSCLCNQMSGWDGVWIKMEFFEWTSQNWILPTCDSFPLIVSHMCTRCKRVQMDKTSQEQQQF